MSHDNQDCKRWLQSKGTLTKFDQNYGELLRAKVDLSTCKTSIIIFGAKPHKPVPPTKELDDPKTQQLGTLATKDKGTAHPDRATHNDPTPAKQQSDQNQ